MSIHDPNEPWQADVNGEIYDTSFGELTQWIAESALLEADKVRRGELRWLEAGKVPPLRPFFDAKTNGTEPPYVHVTVTEAVPQNEMPIADGGYNAQIESVIPVVGDVENRAVGASYEESSFADVQAPDQEFCGIHGDVESKFICEACGHGFCKECPQSFGSSVRLCPFCGSMCREKKELQQDVATDYRIERANLEGFGFSDLGTAIAYPFRFKMSLFFGALIYAVLAYAQKAMGIGSMFLIGAGIFCFVIATGFVFGMISNTVNNFAKGDIESDFLPSFEDFSPWDDIISPFFNFVASWIVSFGFATVVGVIMIWYAISTVTSAMNPNGLPATGQPGVFSEDPSASQISTPGIPVSKTSVDHVEAVKKKLRDQNAAMRAEGVGEDGLTDAQRATVDEEAEFQRLNDLANNYKKQSLEPIAGPTDQEQTDAVKQMAGNFLKTAGAFIFLIFFGLLWGLFFFPASCAVAGYTQSFRATINPFVAVDTIKHLGFDYFKLLVMLVVVWIMGAVVIGVLSALLAPLDMPTVGNLPVAFLGGFLTFYLYAVFGVLLGLVLYKNSNSLQLLR
ncbi:MAG: hypothetical protein R2684_07755 [Pyrinomonadaceae bacterium]